LAQPPVNRTPESRLIELQSVDSTNNYALRLIHEGLAQHGTIILAHNQTAGKGQRGRAWEAEAGENLTSTLIIKPGPLSIGNPFALSCAAALGTFTFFRDYAGDDSKIKWPNDIYWRDRKAGGILIENRVRSGNKIDTALQWSAIGTGININQTSFSPQAGRPVSLKQITGKSFSIPDLARVLAGCILNQVGRISDNQFPDLLKEYNEVLFMKEEQVTLKKGARRLSVIIKGVNETGRLITQGAMEESFDFGEAEWVL
jgi:BirA family transcriptional regulator, biotin operon repressor / biotin---[acetyl-CoA-carboxylase] ligase